MGVLRHPLGRWVDPAAAFAALYAGEPRAFWLDSGHGAETGVSYLGAGASVVDSLGELERSLAEDASTSDAADPAFALGYVGWLGYESRGETTGERVGRSSGRADAMFLRVEAALAFDHAAGTVDLLALGETWSGARGEWRARVLAALDATVCLPARAAAASAVTWRYSDAEYLDLIRRAQAAIADGDAYQVCLTNEAALDVHPDPFATFLALRASSPAHHAGLIVCDGVALVSASPEQFLSISPSGVVSTSPIKGTRPRGADAAADEALAEELRSSEKERAENLMIVDLMRNDLGRVCEVGSVEVARLFDVESYANVHQLVSEVRGRLASDRSRVDIVRATFPAGSMTGAPKISATRIIDELEARPRGIYSGVFGYLGFDGSVDLAMVIRSIVIDPSGATVGAGGGITALSDPGEELAEAKLKAAPLLRVLGVGPASAV